MDAATLIKKTPSVPKRWGFLKVPEATNPRGAEDSSCFRGRLAQIWLSHTLVCSNCRERMRIPKTGQYVFAAPPNGLQYLSQAKTLGICPSKHRTHRNKQILPEKKVGNSQKDASNTGIFVMFSHARCGKPTPIAHLWWACSGSTHHPARQKFAENNDRFWRPNTGGSSATIPVHCQPFAAAEFPHECLHSPNSMHRYRSR